MTKIQFGSDSEHVRILLPTFDSRAGWIDVEVEISVTGFHGRLKPCVEAADLAIFISQLNALYATLKGSAELRPREKQFVLLLSAHSLGHIQVSGEAWSHATYGSKLEFEFELDQSFLAQPISALEQLHTIVRAAN